MAKKFKAIVRLQLEAGKANPAPRWVLRWRVMVSISWRFVRSTTPARRIVRAKFSGRDHRLHRWFVHVRVEDLSGGRAFAQGCQSGEGFRVCRTRKRSAE